MTYRLYNIIEHLRSFSKILRRQVEREIDRERGGEGGERAVGSREKMVAVSSSARSGMHRREFEEKDKKRGRGGDGGAEKQRKAENKGKIKQTEESRRRKKNEGAVSWWKLF